MEKYKGITLVELITILVVVTLFILILEVFIVPRIGVAHKVYCSTNLKGLGTAMTVYGNDYDDEYPKLGKGPWSDKLSFDFDDFPISQEGERTITSSWYLLIREADVSPKTFVCPESTQEEFDGFNPENKDILELWDFGHNPYKHISYSYHNPYGKYPAGGWLSASFAVAGDISPWFKNGSIIVAGSEMQPPQIITQADKSTWKSGLGQNHKDEGQNVLWADGHASFEKYPNVGIKNYNIYTFWSVEENPSEQDRQGGTAPTGRSAENDAKSEADSFLAI